jgi:hypothetical protein
MKRLALGIALLASVLGTRPAPGWHVPPEG